MRDGDQPSCVGFEVASALHEIENLLGQDEFHRIRHLTPGDRKGIEASGENASRCPLNGYGAPRAGPETRKVRRLKPFIGYAAG